MVSIEVVRGKKKSILLTILCPVAEIVKNERKEKITSLSPIKFFVKMQDIVILHKISLTIAANGQGLLLPHWRDKLC